MVPFLVELLLLFLLVYVFYCKILLGWWHKHRAWKQVDLEKREHMWKWILCLSITSISKQPQKNLKNTILCCVICVCNIVTDFCYLKLFVTVKIILLGWLPVISLRTPKNYQELSRSNTTKQINEINKNERLFHRKWNIKVWCLNVHNSRNVDGDLYDNMNSKQMLTKQSYFAYFLLH